jgi:hypothetical protein
MNKELAVIIKNQLVGTYSGHMAAVPFNPVLHSIFSTLIGGDPVYGIDYPDQDVALVLRQIADALDEVKP